MTAGLDYRLFWRQLRKLKGKPRSACSKLVYENTTFDTTNCIADGLSTFLNIFLMMSLAQVAISTMKTFALNNLFKINLYRLRLAFIETKHSNTLYH